MAFGHGWVFTPRLRSVRYGRKATKHVRNLLDRFWLQAADRHIVIYVGFTSNFGSSDAEFPLLEALRTKPGVPRPAAFDPKRKHGSWPWPSTG